MVLLRPERSGLVHGGGGSVEHGSVWSRRRVLAGAVATAGFLKISDALAGPPSGREEQILQLVLQLEYTQVAFYEQALKQAGLAGELQVFARTALGHERQHLAAIRSALGSKAAAKPRFDFGPNVNSAGAFRQAAIKLEDAAVAAYNGQATNLTPTTLAAAAEIVSVEARHAAWVRAIAGEVAAPEPVDKPITANDAVQALHAIGLKA
jgi:hypothetical protein